MDNDYLAYFRKINDDCTPAKAIPTEYGAYIATGERPDPVLTPRLTKHERNIQMQAIGTHWYCQKCDEHKPVSHFYKGDNFKTTGKSNPNGYYNVCKPCWSQYVNAKNKARRLASRYKRARL